jgi:protein CpxP
MLADVAPLRAATIKKIKGVLTPAQVVKYDKLIKESKNSTLNGGWSDGWTSAN